MDERIIADFICCGKYMVVVRIGQAVHVMGYDEWKSVYGKLHPERWENGKHVERIGKSA